MEDVCGGLGQPQRKDGGPATCPEEQTQQQTQPQDNTKLERTGNIYNKACTLTISQ